MKEQIKKDRSVLKYWANYKHFSKPFFEGVVSHSGPKLWKYITNLLAAQARIGEYETERRVRAEMKTKISAMCGIPDAGDACRTILNHLNNQNQDEQTN